MSNPAPKPSPNSCAANPALVPGPGSAGVSPASVGVSPTAFGPKVRACLALLSALLGWNAAAAPKPVLVHYMPWFVAKPFSPVWGWHWTMGHYNPDSFDTNGQRQIASWYYPQISPYDSDDAAVLECQVLLMKLAGLDGVIVDWYGMDDYADYGVNNQRTLDLFTWTHKAGLKFALCYEDQTIRQEINKGYITTNQAIAHAQQTMLYVQSNFFNDATYLRWSNQPVFLNFGPQYFGASSNWTTIFSVLAPSNAPAFFTEDNRLSPAGAGAFDWPPMGLSSGGVLGSNQLNFYLIAFEVKARTAPAWPAYISSAFPRFHDIYAQAGVSPSYGYLDDDNGGTFQNTLRRALTNTSALVQVVTWNDYGEGTVVEPTTQYQLRDLGVLQDFRRAYQDANYAGTTNDLSLAFRLYHARAQAAGNTALAAELDRIFARAVGGRLADAALRLSGVESRSPVIYDLSVTNGQLQFWVGGFLAPNGVKIQTTTDASLTNWQTSQTLASGGSGSAPFFTIPISATGGPHLLQGRNSPPGTLSVQAGAPDVCGGSSTTMFPASCRHRSGRSDPSSVTLASAGACAWRIVISGANQPVVIA